MTVLTASHLIDGNLVFSKTAGSAVLTNGTTTHEGNGSRRKLEFIHDGVLAPPNYGPHIVRLSVVGKTPKRTSQLPQQTNGVTADSRSVSLPKAVSPVNVNRLVNGSDGATSNLTGDQNAECSVTVPDDDDGKSAQSFTPKSPKSPSSPEVDAPTSSGSSTYPSEGNTPESITNCLTNVPSPKSVQQSLKGLESEAEEEPEVELPVLPPKLIPERLDTQSSTSSPVKKAVKRLQLVPVSPQSPVKRIIGPMLPPASAYPDSDDEPDVRSSSFEVARLANKRRRTVSERFEQEALYPVVEHSVAQLNTWENCRFVKGVKKGLAGIRNPHNNCFLNSVIQSVCHIPQFMRYALELHVKEQRCVGHKCLLCKLRDHFQRATSHQIVDASWINPHLSDIFPNHLRGTQEDAHEMLLFLLDAVDRQQQQLRRSQPGRFSSIVEQVFDGKTRCEYKCAACDEKSICYEPVRGFSVELGRTNSDDCQSISTIVHDHFRDERIGSYSCRKCQAQTGAIKRMRLVTAPNVLILQLKRFHRFSKNSSPVYSNYEINMTKLMHNGEATTYRLLGYIKHLGSHMSSGHYVASMVGFDGEHAFHYDDETSGPFDLQRHRLSQPYVLFYAKVDPSPVPASLLKPIAKKARYHFDISSSLPLPEVDRTSPSRNSDDGRRNGYSSSASTTSSAASPSVHSSR